MKTIMNKARTHIREQHKELFQKLDNFVIEHLMRMKKASAAVEADPREAWRRKHVNL